MLAYYGMKLLVHQEAAPRESKTSLEEVLKEEIELKRNELTSRKIDMGFVREFFLPLIRVLRRAFTD